MTLTKFLISNRFDQGWVICFFWYQLFCWKSKGTQLSAVHSPEFNYNTFASSRLGYHSILDSFGQSSKYISVKFSLYKLSENPWANPCLQPMVTNLQPKLKQVTWGFISTFQYILISFLPNVLSNHIPMYLLWTREQ